MSPTITPLQNENSKRLLLVSDRPVWPPHQGFRLRGMNMAKTLTAMGHEVTLASVQPLPDDAPDELVAMSQAWPSPTPSQQETFEKNLKHSPTPMRWIRQKLASYRGIDADPFAGVLELVETLQPDAVIALGQLAPAVLMGLGQTCPATKLWYAADEGAYFQLSCMVKESIGHWPKRLRSAAFFAAMERGFGPGLDGVIGVHPRDTRLLQWVTGAPVADTIQNGVDLDYFAPRESDHTQKPSSSHHVIFWGRLDFEPNIDAANWLAMRLMPLLLERVPDAKLQLIGREPTDEVNALGELPGVEVVGPVDDLRPWAWQAGATVMPMRCGGGIKNKLLEAAALGLPILASQRAVGGLSWDQTQPPFWLIDQPEQCVEQLTQLWNDPAADQSLREKARQWVASNHTWSCAADRMICLIERASQAGRFRGGSQGQFQTDHGSADDSDITREKRAA